MKKVILIFGLFLIMTGLSNAQETKTISYRQEIGPIYAYCFCGENYLGYATGKVDLHWVLHFENGDLVWMTLQGTKSTLEGQDGEIKGETFTLSEMDKFTFSDGVEKSHLIVHSNLKGDRGHHFNLSGYIDYVNDNVVYDKAICPGGK